ncbi:MAG: YfhO family protein [Flexilinea sp.]
MLSREPVDLRMIDSSNLAGSFSCVSDDQYIFFSIPYDSAWKILLDGKPVLPIKMMYDLMGVKVPQGEHQIKLRYIPDGFIKGSFISAASVIILIIDSLIRKNRNSPKRAFLKRNSQADHEQKSK